MSVEAKRALLDVNVLVALHDPHHVHHGDAAGWFAANAGAGWASCPLTQNGCLRVMSQPGYLHPLPLPVLWPALHASFTSSSHVFWADDASLFDEALFRRDRIHGHRQLTDLYLLGLAVRRGGRLVTLDTRLPLEAVRGAKADDLVVIDRP